MANSFEDFLGSFTLESPDFKRALKILIKYEIHVLLQRLSDTGEESVVITASIADRTNGHLGSQKGRSFLKETKIKALEEQFLHYCTEQPYEQRIQFAVGCEGSSPVYIKQEPREMLMGYDDQEMKRRQRPRNDRNCLEGADNRRLIHDSSSRSAAHMINDMMDQSDDSVVSISKQVENSVTQLLSKFDESQEMASDCYSERGLIGRCNDVCCRGSYLDLVGPSIRPAIPTLDRSVGNWAINKPDEAGTQNDDLSYLREQTYCNVVDLTSNKTEGTTSDINTRHNLAEALSDDRENTHALFEQIDYKRTPVENGFQSDPGHSQEMLNCFAPRSGVPKSPIENVLVSPSTEDLSKQQSGTNQNDFTMGNKLDMENRCLRTTVASEIEFENRGKRKLCSRVPECKLRHLLQEGCKDVTKLIGDTGKVLVKSEPFCEENEPKIESSLKTQDETGLNIHEPLERLLDTDEISYDLLTKNVKQEEMPSAMDKQHINETISTELGRSLRFICRYCNQMFKNKQFREFHEKLHLARHPYICESCGAGFNEENILEEHSKIHITNPLLKCENCGYRTSRKFRMNSHREICGKPSKLFLCPYCQKPFLAKRYMKVHMKSHDLSSVHHCPYCVNTYPLKNSLLKHMKTKHKRF